MAGKVWLIGAGPGDPSLVTARGREVLGRADVVLYDALSHPGLLEACRPDAEVRNVGKRGGKESPSQAWITEQLIELARAGKVVARLKGGDPLLFARGAEEAEDLARAGIPFEIVPGVSSPVAASAYAGIPLTHREVSSSVTFITGSDREGVEWTEDAWKRLATATDTICILMGMRRLEQIARALVAGGRAETTPVAVVQWAARPEQKVLVSTLGRVSADVAARGITNPAVVIVGEVVRLRDALRWYDRAPLFGKRLLVPRPAHQAKTTAQAIYERGAEPVVFPVIEIGDPADAAPFRRAVTTLASYDWVLFTSANGVERTFAELACEGRDARAFGGAKVGAIGPGTAAALAAHGVRADATATEYVGEGLAKTILERGGVRRALLLRAQEARDALPDLLRKSGAVVDVVAAYATRRASVSRGAELARLFEERAIDAALFTSSSTVDGVFELLGPRAKELLAGTTLACIGPVTQGTLEKHGLSPTVVAAEYTIQGLLDALATHYAARH
ncbi:MAG TPA: uroporphyrinogen-III C-methyltransferase [Polyangiaceae bacterium]|nr:uroporphyrinogen-III C-methyltransferase [Polyangiaceae bacterium]